MPSPRHRRLPSTTFILYLYLKSPLHSSTITPAPLAIYSTLLLSTTTPLLPCRQQQRGPIKSYQNLLPTTTPLPLVDYQYINDNINRHNSPLLCHSVSTVCYHHWSNVKQVMIILIVIPVVVAVSKWLHLQLLGKQPSLSHIFLSTAYTYSNHHNNPPKNITLYVIYISQQRRNIHYILWTLREFLMSDVLPLSSWRSIYIGIGEVGGINLVHLASTWRQRHIWRSLSRGTPHHYFHTAMLLQDAVWGYVMNSSLSR